MSTNIESVKPSDNPNDTILELQLGDVISITSPLNELLNEQTFIIDYIDKSKAYLINTETMEKIRVPISSDGTIGDGNITRIAILSRSDTPSYARQNGLLPGKWINIYFEGDFPVIITGEITNLENDMIEIKTIDGDVIYINFDYKGLPENLPIEMIEIRGKPSEPLTKPEIEEGQQEEKEEGQEQDLEEIPELKPEKKFVEPEKIQINIPIKDVKDQIRQFIIEADQVKFGDEEFGPIVQYVDVESKSQRYSIETQVSDLLDELLSTIPNAQRTPKVLNNIHTMIQRFKQLREHFSIFDQYGNVDGFLVKESNFKPLASYFNKLKINLYWILPVVKNIKKIYNSENNDDENNDIINLDIDTDLRNIKDLIENYKTDDLPNEQNKYSSLYSNINPYFTPFDSIDYENTGGIITQKYVLTNINTVIDNLEEMYSSIFSGNAIRNRRFVIQKYNTALSKLDTVDSTGAKLVTVRTNITNNDLLSVKSFITLPEPVIRFSKINLPGTNILDKANLNLSFINYWQLLKKKTNVNTIFVDNFEDKIDFNEQNFANNVKNFVLNESDELKGMNINEIYKKFVDNIIPKTKILFNLMKKYINGKLSIVDVISYLEPFLVYSDDLTFMQYIDITDFINDKISDYNKKYVERSRVFKMLGQIRQKENIIFSKAFSIIDILDKKLRNEVLIEGYDIDEDKISLTNSEILRKITLRDYTKLYTTAISVQNFPLIFPSEFSTIFDQEKENLDKKLDNEEASKKCQTVIISKYYTSLAELEEDNDKVVYFDKKYDKTNYGVLEESTGYEKEVLSMSPEELREHIKRNLMEKKRMSENDAEYLSETLVDGHKKVIDGQFAILYKGYQQNSADEIDFYIRKDNKWVLDSNMNKQNINTDDSSLLCDIQKQCINVTKETGDNCESFKEDELGMQTKLLKDIISEFDTKYKISSEQLKTSIDEKFQYYQSLIAILNKIQTNELLKYNNQKYKLGVNAEEDKTNRPLSPYKPLLNLIMGQSDFVKKQRDIVKFTNTFTRESLQGFGPLSEKEHEHWLYCIKSNVPLLPSFVYNLADSFITGGQYEYIKYLEIVKSQVGKLSDDGELWCDKNSGWTICPVDLDFEEGYEEGFKVATRAVMEEDAGAKIISALAKSVVKYDTIETKMINNIVNTLSIAMGINVETQKEFIINTVLLSIKETVESESDYKLKVREKAEKGEKLMISYTDFYNTALLYYTLGMFLIAVQTSIPSVKTRKTHSGCVRSFSGYPFEGVGDLSSLAYLGCVAYDIRESGEPWNVLKRKKQEVINNRIKASIDDVLLANPDVKRKFEEKTDYLLTNPSTEIPEEHDIAKWSQFLPPLVKYKIKHLVNISPEFKKSLLSDLRSGSINQRERLLVVESKIIQFSLALIERIQEIVKKHHMLLHTAGNQPYLENSCCETKEDETTIGYFSKHDPRITEYNEIVTNLSNMMEDIISYSKGSLFFSNENTKNKYPSILSEFSEKTIYMSFIKFCRFKSLVPISQDLLPICTNKPEKDIINPNDSLDRIIQKLKEDGRNYTNEQFLRMLQIVSQNNIVNINIDNPEISSITKLIKLLESINDENDEVVEQSLIKLINNSLDNFDIATENYTREVKDLNDFLIRNIAEMKEEIIEFVQQNTGSNISTSSIRKMIKTIKNLSNWVSDSSKREVNNKISDEKLYNIINFYKSFVDNFVSVFPNIILNKVNYDDINIPNYYGFSKNHAGKLKKYVSGYYEKLKIFYGIPTLENILTTIQESSKNLTKLAKSTPSFTSIKLNEDKIIKPVFDERTSRFLFEYYLLRVLINFIELSDRDDMIVTEVRKETEITDIFASEYIEEIDTRIDISMSSRQQTDINLLTGNKKVLRQKTSELLIAFINILDNQKDTIDTSYEEIQDRVFKLREKEKDMVTDRLKKMTDEQRDADTILKINKLGMYGKGMQKGLTTLDKDFYDEEQQFRDKMEQAERTIRKNNSDATDENIDMLVEDYLEQQEIDNDIDNEAYDMGYLNETFYDGNTDGVSAPEEEYDDYQDDN
jgi:hypothetical protein